MNWIIGIVGLLIIGGFGALAVFKEKKKYAICGGVIGLSLMVFSQSFVIIPTGYTGVKTTFSQIDNVTLQNGFNWKLPFAESIELVNNKQQDIKYEGTIYAESSDKAEVFYDQITVSYTIGADKSAWIYANVSNYEDNLVSSEIVTSGVKKASVELTADEATNRSKIEPLALEKIQSLLDEKYGEGVVNINMVVIGSADYTDEYNDAVNARQTAQMELEKQQIENQKAVEKAESDAEAAKIAAQGEADAAKTKAEGEAEANKLLNDSLTDKVLKEKYIEKWDGKLPTVSSDAGTIIDIGSVTDASEASD